MKNSDFVFTIGYQGDAAIVDRKVRKELEKKTARELADAGYYKPAFCRASEKGDQETLEYLQSVYNRNSRIPFENLGQMKRLFGVFSNPEDIDKTLEV